MAGSPSDADLRRAISTAYYALFHAVAHACAELFPTNKADDFSGEARRLAYRALEHGLLRQSCSNPGILRRLPLALSELAQILPTIQAKRHQADYGLSSTLSAGEIADDIKACERAIIDFLAAPEADRRAFVAFVLFRSR